MKESLVLCSFSFFLFKNFLKKKENFFLCLKFFQKKEGKKKIVSNCWSQLLGLRSQLRPILQPEPGQPARPG